ncbi:putative stress-induced protein STI1 [Russula dissimulans]|nr:putative stress-induced protein STI1 [Russula dissimulans]
MSEKQQRLVLSIIQFLNHSINDGTIREEDKESLEVAVQCIGEAFGIDPADKEQVNRLSVKPATLQTIFDVFLKTKDKLSSTAQVAPNTSPAAPSAEDKAAAEKLKQQGNALMSSKQHDKAIDVYTEAIKLDPTNPVYYSNRAAAHSSKSDHLSAAVDAEKAIELDPKFARGYSRLGHARYSIGDHAAAATAYRRGLELEPNNAAMQTGLRNSENAQTTDDGGDAALPPSTASSDAPADAGAGGLGGLADALRNMGGAGAGGMPDLASVMNNPAMMQMAQQMMANGGLERLLSNPTVANMMDQLNSGGSLPSMQELMGNPELRDLAQQFGAGQR